MKKILAMAVLAIFLSGCASVCKPPLVVIDTVEQEGMVLRMIHSDLDTLSKEELKASIMALIESNQALKKYYLIKEDTHDKPK